MVIRKIRSFAGNSWVSYFFFSSKNLKFLKGPFSQSTEGVCYLFSCKWYHKVRRKRKASAVLPHSHPLTGRTFQASSNFVLDWIGHKSKAAVGVIPDSWWRCWTTAAGVADTRTVLDFRLVGVASGSYPRVELEFKAKGGEEAPDSSGSISDIMSASRTASALSSFHLSTDLRRAFMKKLDTVEGSNPN